MDTYFIYWSRFVLCTFYRKVFEWMADTILRSHVLVIYYKTQEVKMT